MPWPTIEARRSAPPSHMYTQRTTPSPHTLYRHVSDIQQVCTDTLVALTDLQEDTFLLSLSTTLLDSSHTNQNTRILFAFFFLSFVPELWNFFCSLLVCAYCICQHLVSCGHCCFWIWILLISVGFIFRVGWERREAGGGFRIVCLLQFYSVWGGGGGVHSSTSWHSLRLKKCSCIT